MKKYLVPLLVLGICSLVIAAPAAAVPQYLNYQGVLRDSAGNLVTGNKAMTFKIYDAASGGSELFSMTSPEVSVSNGLYTVPLGPLSNTELASGRRWLEVTVGSDTLAPRLEILAVAYAITAASAESASKLGAYSPAASGANIIPITDGSGKLDAAVIPSSGPVTSVAYADVAGTATTAAYATLSGTATNAGTVDNIDANAAPTANTLYPLDANAKLSGIPISAEASGNNYAMFIDGRLGATSCVGTGTLSAAIAQTGWISATISSSSVIIVSVGNGESANTGAAAERALAVTAIDVVGQQFKIGTVDGTTAHDGIPYSYLIIN